MFFEFAPRLRFWRVPSGAIAAASAFVVWLLLKDDTAGVRRFLLALLDVRKHAVRVVVAGMVLSTALGGLLYWRRVAAVLAEDLIKYGQHQTKDEPFTFDTNGRLAGWCFDLSVPGHPDGAAPIVVAHPSDDELKQCRDGGGDVLRQKNGQPDGPLLALAQPAVRKRPFMFALWRRLVDSDEPALLITTRECYSAGHLDLERCVEEELRKALDRSGSMVPVSLEAALTEWARSKWWLLIDGIDDSGNAKDIVRWLRDVNGEIQKRDGHVVVSARPQVFEYVLRTSFGDDIAKFIGKLRDESATSRRVVHIRGLTTKGKAILVANRDLDRESQDVIRKIERATAAAEPARRHRLERMVSDVRRMRALLARTEQLAPTEIILSNSLEDDLAHWGALAQFDATCYGENCGDDETRARLEQAFRQVVAWFAECHRETVRVSDIAMVLHDVGLEDSVHLSRLLHVLLGSGFLHVRGRDEFDVKGTWATKTLAVAPMSCLSRPAIVQDGGVDGGASNPKTEEQ